MKIKNFPSCQILKIGWSASSKCCKTSRGKIKLNYYFNNISVFDWAKSFQTPLSSIANPSMSTHFACPPSFCPSWFWGGLTHIRHEFNHWAISLCTRPSFLFKWKHFAEIHSLVLLSLCSDNLINNNHNLATTDDVNSFKLHHRLLFPP